MIQFKHNPDKPEKNYLELKNTGKDFFTREARKSPLKY